MWAPPTCLYFQIEDGGLGVPRRAAPLHRRRERRHSAALWAAAAAARSQEHAGRCPYQPLQWWVLDFIAGLRYQGLVLVLCSANACVAFVCSVSRQWANASSRNHVASPCSSRGSLLKVPNFRRPAKWGFKSSKCFRIALHALAAFSQYA